MKAPKSDKINSAQLIIDLKPQLEDFLRHEMSCKDGPIMLSRSNDAGKFLYSMINTCSIPPKKIEHQNPVELAIPLTSANKHIIRYRFLFVSKWAEEKIQDYLDASFRFRMHMMFELGYKKGYAQKDIIESILQAYNMRNTAVNYDFVKKADYRHRRKIREMIFKDLQCADL